MSAAPPTRPASQPQAALDLWTDSVVSSKYSSASHAPAGHKRRPPLR
jgi:hypothetical protein